MKKALAALLTLATLAGSALADTAPPAMPAGHPAMPAGKAQPSAHAMGGPADMSKSDAPLNRQGKVLTVIDAKQFTYFEVQDGANKLWVVAPSIALKPGNIVKFADSPLQPKYHSPSLNRDFSNILFTVKAVAQ